MSHEHLWTITIQLNCLAKPRLTQVRLARRIYGNFLAVNQVCPLRVQPREKEIIFFSFKRHGVFKKKASTFTAR